jgi:hypothetical protein
MGLGTDRGVWEDYEWFDVASLATEPADPYVDAALLAISQSDVWVRDGGSRVLLVDLDNVRVEPGRLRARLAMAVALARESDAVAFAGQEGSVRRALPSLAEFAPAAISVGDDHDEADHALLDAADDVTAAEIQFVVLSNDGIFARLAMRGPLTVLSPGSEALSDRLTDAARLVIDLQRIEADVIA